MGFGWNFFTILITFGADIQYELFGKSLLPFLLILIANYFLIINYLHFYPFSPNAYGSGTNNAVSINDTMLNEHTVEVNTSKQDLTNSVNLSKNIVDENKNPQIVTDENGKIFVVWEDFTQDQILFSRSIDGGKTFNDPVILNREGRGNNPQITVADGIVYVVWEKRYNMVAFTRSTDDGISFSKEIVWGNESSTDIKDSKLQVIGSNVYLLFFNSESESTSVSFVHSEDGGLSFSGRATIGENVTVDSTKTPRIATDGKGNIYVAWFEGDMVLLRKSVDGGNTFSNPAIAPFNGANCSSDLELSVSLNNVYAVCVLEAQELREGRTPGTHYYLEYRILLFTHSIDNGDTFAHTVSMTDKLHSDVFHPPLLATSDNRVYIAYDDYSPDNSSKDVYLIRGFDNDTFHYPVDISNDSGESALAGLEIGYGKIYLTWYYIPSDSNGNRQIFYSGININGKVFSPSKFIGNHIPDYGQSYFKVNNRFLLVVWTEGEGSNTSIQFARVPSL